MIRRISQVSGWLIAVSRPVLQPLGASVLFCHLYFVAHLALLGVGAWAISTLAVRASAGQPANIGPVALILTLAALTLAKAVFNYFEHFLGHLVAFKALELLRVELYRALVPQATQRRVTSGDLLTRATKDIDRIEVFFAHTLAPAITAVTIPLITLLCALPWVGAPTVSVAALGLLASIVGVPLVGARRSMQGAIDVNEARGNIAHHVTDSIQGMAEVTGYGHVRGRLAELAQLDEAVARCQAPRGRAAAAREGLAVMVNLGTLLATVLVGVAAAVEPVALAVFVTLLWGMSAVTLGVREFAATLDASLAAAERVFAIVSAPPAVQDVAQPQPLPIDALSVAFEDVDYAYPSETQLRPNAATAISFTVAAGTHACLVGASGSGKSTLLQLVARYDDPARGRIRVGGVDATQVGVAELRRRVLLVEQTATLFSGTVADNLRLAAPDATAEQMLHALRVVALEEELRERGGLDAEVGEGAGHLSGGQRQRLALARAVLLRPDVLLLDEYTAHLDAATAARVRANLREELPALTILESTHSAAGLDQADLVVVLDNGRIQALGSPQQVGDSAPLVALMAREARVQ